MQNIKKYFMTLALLLTAVGGAWATTPNSIVINGTPQVGDKSISLTYHFDPNNVPGIELYAPTLKVKCAADNKWDETLLSLSDVSSGTTNISLSTLGEFEAGKTYEVCFAYYNGTWVDDVFQSFVPAASGTPVTVDWNKTSKTGTFTMPGGNVTLEPEYYPQAALAAAPTAINDVPATTDGAIVEAGTVANIGETTTAQGTVMYYVSQTALDDAALQALAADQWTADVPTAAGLAQGQAYVYYYVRGNDGDTDEENFSDGDILAANALTVTIAAEPTYAVTFADDTAEPTLWTADPAADVKKGTDVTVTYTGSKKVIGVKAEKKAKAPALNITNPVVGQVIGSDGKNYAYGSLPTGVTAVAKICYVSGSNGLALALADEEGTMNWSTAQTTCAAHTPAFTGGTWKLASEDEWKNMISAVGSYDDLRDGFSSVGGTNMEPGDYWSSSDVDSDNASFYLFNEGYWSEKPKDRDSCVRACLAF